MLLSVGKSARFQIQTDLICVDGVDTKTQGHTTGAILQYCVDHFIYSIQYHTPLCFVCVCVSVATVAPMHPQ